MAADFPGDVVEFVRPTHSDSFIDGGATDGTVLFGKMADEIEAIETYLLGGGGGGGGGFSGVSPAELDYFNLGVGADVVELEQNELIAFPVFIPGEIDIDAFCVSVILEIAGGSVRVGLYDADLDALVVELGTKAVTSAGLATSTPGTPETCSGLMHIGIALQGGATCQLQGVEGFVLPSAAGAFGQQVYIHDGTVSSTLPSNFVVDSTTTGPVPAVGLRRASA